MRTEPPVSVPREKSTSPPATTVAEPLDDHAARVVGKHFAHHAAQALPLGAGWALAWLKRVHDLTGNKPIIYLSGSVAEQAQWDQVVKADFGLWVANWTGGAGGHATPPAVSGNIVAISA